MSQIQSSASFSGWLHQLGVLVTCTLNPVDCLVTTLTSAGFSPQCWEVSVSEDSLPKQTPFCWNTSLSQDQCPWQTAKHWPSVCHLRTKNTKEKQNPKNWSWVCWDRRYSEILNILCSQHKLDLWFRKSRHLICVTKCWDLGLCLRKRFQSYPERHEPILGGVKS